MRRSFVRKESSGSVKVFWLDREALIDALKKEAERIGRSDPNVLKIVLFGSLAEGKATPRSDADLLVVLRGSDRPFLKRITEWLERFSVDFPVEVFPYTLGELEAPLARTALKKGIVLYERKEEGR